MLTAALIEGDLALLAPARGQFPAQALVLGPDGWARIDLLPAVAPGATMGLTPEALTRASALVARHRDALLAAWATPGAPIPPGAPDGPRAAHVAVDPARKAVAVRLHGGAAITFPAGAVPGLAEADPAAATEVVPMAGGEVLAWRRLGLFVRVPDLVLAVTGGPGWRDRLAAAAVPPWHAPPPRPAAVGVAAAGPRPAPAARIKSLIGLIIQRENYLSPDQLQAVFQRQMQLKHAGQDKSFGEVAIEAGLLTEAQVQFAVHLQDRLAHGADGGKPLGVYLLESAAVMPSHLMAALDEQKATGRRLGEILIERGTIGRATLEDFLARQREVRGEGPPVPDAPPQVPDAPPQVPEGPPPASEAPPPAPEAPAPESQAHEATAPAPEPEPQPVAVAAAVAVASPPADPAPAEPKVRSLLAIILEREGYLTQAQVRDVIAEMERIRASGKNVTFAEVAMNSGFLTATQVRFAMALQKRLSYQADKPKPLGLILLENGVVRPSQIQLALEEQQRSGRRMGEILIEQGLISEGMLEVFLNMQRQGM